MLADKSRANRPIAKDATTIDARSHQRQILRFALIIVLALGARIYRIGDSGFWLDEFCSVECSTGRGLMHMGLPRDVVIASPPLLTTLDGAPPWWKIWGSMSLDNHPPLYFILLRFWRDLFGQGDVAARAFSIVPSIVAIFFFYDALRVQFKRDGNPTETSRADSIALWGSLLMAIAMPQIYYAQQARGYSLLAAFGMAGCSAIIRLEKLGFSRFRAIGLAIAVLGMMLAHYYGIAPIAVISLYALLRLRGPTRRWTILALIGSAVVYAIIWGPFLWQQRQSVAANNAWQIEPVNGHLILTLSRMVILPARLFSESLAEYTPWVFAGAIVYFVPLFFLRKRPEMLFWYLWLLTPILLVVAVDILRNTKQTDLIRYSVIAGPGLYALVAAGISEQNLWARHGMPAVVALLCLLFLPKTYSEDRNWPLLADVLQSHVQSGDAIIYASAGRDDWYAGALYLGVSHYAGPLPAPIVLMTHHADKDVRDWALSHPTIWLIAGSDKIAATQLLPGSRDVQHFNLPGVGVLWQLAPGLSIRDDIQLQIKTADLPAATDPPREPHPPAP